MKIGELSKLSKEKRSPLGSGILYGGMGAGMGIPAGALNTIRAIKKKRPETYKAIVTMHPRYSKIMKRGMKRGALIGAAALGTTAALATLISNSLKGKR